jgi:polysaccharide pyruvyl transferase WcaK-like protein
VECGVKPDAVTVAADMAWLIEPAGTDFGRDCLHMWGFDMQRPLIGVNLVNENLLFEQQPLLVDELAAALDALACLMDASVIFLSNEIREGPTFDKAAALQVMQKMKRSDRAIMAPNDYLSPNQMLSLIGCCDLTMSMRYHFCLFSALQGTPFVAIERSGKLSDLCWDIDWPARIVPAQLKAVDVIQHGMLLSQTTSEVKQGLRRSVRKMRDRALRNVTALHTLM